MAHGESRTGEREGRFNQVLADYLEAEEAGRAPDCSELFARHPDLADELKEFLDNRAELAGLAESDAGHDAAAAAPTQEAAPASTNRVGDYELLGEIARGGMGIVYRARQVSANRQVALKMMLAGAQAQDTAQARFRIEAEAAASLDHPNIVPIYDVGTINGRPYFTMKLVEGGSLAARRDEFTLGRGATTARARRIAELMATVARAVHHAHLHGILHRDLKPANILLAGDVPMVTDFGLAKRTRYDGGLTQIETILGTPAYMAPEQAQPTPGGLSTAADVYSLGAILYELLTGRPPFVGASFVDVLLMLLQQTPAPPRQLNPSVPSDLEMICLKCLEKYPARRYRSALELAEDLDRWRAGDAISLRRLGTVERAWRWTRRNPLSALLLGVVAALMMIVTLGSATAAWFINAARQVADRNAEVAQFNATVATDQAAAAHTARDEALQARNLALQALAEREKTLRANRQLLVSGYVGNGTRALDSGDPFGALVWYGEALRLEAADAGLEEPHRVRLAGALRRCPHLVQVWFDHEWPPAFSADGQRVALLSKNTARVWRVDNGEAASPELRHAAEVRHASFSGDGRHLLTLTAGGDAAVWDLGARSPAAMPLKHGKAVSFAAFSPDGSRVVTVGGDQAARLWRTQDAAAAGGPFKQTTPMVFASFSRDGKRLVTCGGEQGKAGAVHTWDITGGKKPVHTAFTLPAPIRLAYLTADNKQIVTVGGRRVARLLDAATGKELASVASVRGQGEGAVSPEATRVIKLDGTTARIFDIASGQAIAAPLTHGGEVYYAAFSPDGRSVVTAARERGARVWDAATGHALTPLLRHPRMVHHAWFSGDGRLLMTQTEDTTLRVWEVAPREPLQRLTQLGDKLTLSPDGRSIATIEKDGAVRLHDTATGKPSGGPWKLPSAVTHLAFAPDGSRLVLVADRTARVWDAGRGIAVTPLLKHPGSVQHVQFTPDGSRVALLGASGLLQVWDAATGEIQSARPRPGSIAWRGLALSPDGRAALAVKPAHIAELFDVVSAKALAGPFKHAAAVTQAAFSPDGKRLAVGSADGSTYLWDVERCQQAGPPLQHGVPLHLVEFSADGRRLATIAEDQTARVWDTETGLAVSPLLSQSEPIVRASLGADGRLLWLRGKSGAVRTWDLTSDDRPLADLLRLTELLSGQRLNRDSGGFEHVAMVDLRRHWPTLRTRYPQDFRLRAP
jgi:eukaryotic-like serine/threonine-protein kinase